MSFQPKNELVLQAALSVQTLILPFTITGSATPASVVFKADQPSVLFVKTQGTDRCTVAAGALDSTDTVPTFATATDASGNFSFVVRIGEKLAKVVSCAVEISSSTANSTNAVLTATPATGIVVSSLATQPLDKICMDVKGAPAFNSATTVSGCLVLRYIVA